MLSPRENILNFYNHKPMDQFTTLFECISHTPYFSGWHERPPFYTSGYDWFGAYWVYDPDVVSYVVDPRKPAAIADVDALKNMKFPDLDAINWEEAARLDQIDKQDRVNKAHWVMVPMGPFERLTSIMGYENAMVAMVTEPEICKEWFERWTEWKCRLIDYLAAYYKPDILQIADDSGTSLSSFYSIEMWREMIKPCWDACAKAIKKHGIPAELHTCGKNQQFLEEMVGSEYDTFFIQCVNDIDDIRRHTEGKKGIIITDLMVGLESDAEGNGVTVKQVRDYVYDRFKHYLETSVNGFDFFPYLPPGPVPENMTDDMVLRSFKAVRGCAWHWIHVKAPEFTEIIQRKNAEWAAKK